MRNTEEYRESQYEEDEDEEYEENEDEEYKEEREAENPHVLAFRQEAEMSDHRMSERLEDDLDLADGTWDSEDTRSLCWLLRESIDITMGKERSEARAEVAETVTRMLFQPLAESTATGKHLLLIRVDRIRDSEKKELLEYLAKDQRAFQTFLADGGMDESDAIKGMHEAVNDGIMWAEGDIEIAREVHNPDMQE